MAKNTSKLIGRYIYKERKKHGLSMQELADLSQLSSSQISVIESGINPSTKKPLNITLTSLELLGKALDLTVHEILENSGYYEMFNKKISDTEFTLNNHIQELFKIKSIKLNNKNKQSIIEYIDNLSDKHEVGK